MPNFRLYLQKKKAFTHYQKAIQHDISHVLQLPVLVKRVVSTYDVFNISAANFALFKQQILLDQVTDEEVLHFDVDGTYIAYEDLPGQFDARADAAIQCFQLIAPDADKPMITTGTIVEFDQLENEQRDGIIQYLVNPVDQRIKNLHKPLEIHAAPKPEVVPIINGFRVMDEDELKQLMRQEGLAMSSADITFIQSHFKEIEQRDPTETELKVLDTYWSDHCRHTTFLSPIKSVAFEEGDISQHIAERFDKYCQTRQEYYGERIDEKPICLMDLATLAAKDLKRRGILTSVEESEEINACSVYVTVDTVDGSEDYLLQFKNETHNHPTEIEPFGGASTCLGGCIRDPLSGRAYVYQAMRISGAANPLEPIQETLPGKLPQQKITTGAAHGFSSYGNQIGLATTQVSEIYHPGYKAKRMEVGAVVAAAPVDWVKRESPQPGDVIILLGGKTGRDGIGGATGSSKEHSEDSLESAGSEVQKGNPPEERKIQRFFRNKNVTTLIKKCNDFGAGGISVAIGELAPGLTVDLNVVPTKYAGLNGTELALSESQERMAVVIDKDDMEAFIDLAKKENLQATHVATVTEEERLVMEFQGQKVVDLSRAFLDSNGVLQDQNVLVTEPQYGQTEFESDSLENILKKRLSSLNVASQQGLAEQFDSSIGASTLQMPFGGVFQKTPAEGSLQSFPTASECYTASAMTWGFDPELSSWSPFHGGSFAVVEALTKLVCLGVPHQAAYFTFQEYFRKLGDDPKNWGLPFAALLGAYEAQQAFECAAIGGKDSMSGSFHDIHVPPTLIAFAVGTTDSRLAISNELKSTSSNLYLLQHHLDALDLPNYKQLRANFDYLQEQINRGIIISAGSVGSDGLAAKLTKMAFGNAIGATIQYPFNLFDRQIGAIIIESQEELDYEHLIKLGETEPSDSITINDYTMRLDQLDDTWSNTFEDIFPTKTDDKNYRGYTNNAQDHVKFQGKKAKPQVFIPVFPGTNCEYDSERMFQLAGAKTTSMVFRNEHASWIEQSIEEFVKQVNNSQILMLSGGFSAGDEPDGSGKFIATVLRNAQVQEAVHNLLNREGLILGICNGFQALVKSGLLPFGQIAPMQDNWPTLAHNEIGRHISQIVRTKVVNNHSPWLQDFNPGEEHQIAISHGEGRLMLSDQLAQELFANGQIATQYIDADGQPTLNRPYNPNGSQFAIEGLTSKDGRIFGKMGHSERMGQYLYRNIPGFVGQDIFTNGVKWFE